MRIFISSTCYDLIDLRAELETFFREAGIEAILSDSLSSEFQTKHDSNSIETCLANVRNCDEFLIILSNRYGPSLGKAGFADVSATHLEYLEAVKCKKPIRMFVRDRLEADFNIWRHNKNKSELILSWCKEQHDWKIFELLKEHRKLADDDAAKNNWFWVFRDSIELKQRLTVDFKKAFARATVDRLAASGRIPFIEMNGKYVNFNSSAKLVIFELEFRNLSSVVAVSPIFEITIPPNKWSLRSIAGQSHFSLKIEWAYNGSIIHLLTRLNYSTLDGQKFMDEGILTITYNPNHVSHSKVYHELKGRKYIDADLAMLVV